MNKALKMFSFIIIGLICIFIDSDTMALSMGRVTESTGVVLRETPGFSSKKIDFLYYNDVGLLNSTLKTEPTSNCSGGWYSMNFNGKTGYVCSKYISTSNYTIRVNAKNGLRIRSGAGTGYSTYKIAPNDYFLTLSSTTKTKGTGCSGGWYKLNYDASMTRYTCSDNTDSYNSLSNVIVTDEKGTTLKNSSFNDTNIKVNYNEGLTLSNKSLYSGKGCTSKYYKVFYKSNEYYVCSSDVLNTNLNGTIIHYSGVNVRKGAGTGYSKYTTLKYGTNISITSSTKYKGTGCTDGWYKFKLNGGEYYVCSSNVSTSSQTTKVANASSVNIRSGAGTSYSIYKTLPKNTTLLLVSTTLTKNSSCPSGWYKIYFNGENKYICSSYTSIENQNTPNETDKPVVQNKVITKKNTSSGNYYLISNWTYRISENYAYIRSSASTSSTLKDTLYLGTEVEVLDSYPAGNGCSSGWYKISYYNKKTGYTCKSLIEKYNDITSSDSKYCNELKAKGFPESYCPYLSYLHKKHPNWTFNAEKTNISFLSAINGESRKNYTQITKSPYLVSNEIAEAGGWRYASDAYIAFMLDPRNYLNEKNIFAFEDLSFNQSLHTESVVRSVVNGTFLDNSTYAGYFVKYGKEYKVSPIHLAARVRQEGSANENYDGVSGYVNTKWNNVTGYVCSSSAKIVESNIGVITYNGTVNIRSGAGTNYRRISSGKKDDSYILVDTKKYSGEGCSVGWNKISINGTNGYICSSNITVKTPTYKKGYINTTSGLNMRTGPGTGYSKVLTANYKDTFNLLNTTKYSGDGCSAGWYKIKLDGYSLVNIYNFYNIGSYGDNPVLRGLAAAAGYVDDLDGTPWNTREKAIKYGAQFIANGYINKGQDTMYYQKFNTGPNSYYNKFTHQYMTNILAPASESLSAYNSYTSLKLLDTKFVFKIPVYDSMPTSSTTHPPVTG